MPATQTKTKMAGDLLRSRLTEIDQEKTRIERALEAMGSVNGNGAAPARGGRPQRRRRGGTRIEQAIKLIAKKPGITAGEMAKAMKIKPNYLYRVLGELEKEGRVKKDGRKYTLASK